MHLRQYLYLSAFRESQKSMYFSHTGYWGDRPFWRLGGHQEWGDDLRIGVILRCRMMRLAGLLVNCFFLITFPLLQNPKCCRSILVQYSPSTSLASGILMVTHFFHHFFSFEEARGCGSSPCIGVVGLRKILSGPFPQRNNVLIC